MEERFELWALVELMGHAKIAGFITEHKFGNQSMLRVDVPEVDGIPTFSRIIAVNAIYAINPMTEADAVSYAKILKSKPLEIWDMERLFSAKINDLIAKGMLLKPELAETNDFDNEF